MGFVGCTAAAMIVLASIPANCVCVREALQASRSLVEVARYRRYTQTSQSAEPSSSNTHRGRWKKMRLIGLARVS